MALTASTSLALWVVTVVVTVASVLWVTTVVVTAVGGDVVSVEVTRMEGKEDFILTGQLGDVMKESARTALSWLRAAAPRLGLVDASSGAALAETVS